MNEIEKTIKRLNILKTDIEHNLVKGNLIKRDLISSKELAELLTTAISALEKQLNGGWIPCREKLPEKGGYYLVSTQYETPRVMIGFYFIELAIWNYWMSNCQINSIIAWQPLPEPFKGGENE